MEGGGPLKRKAWGSPGTGGSQVGMWSALKLQKSSFAIVGGRVVTTLRHRPSVQSVLGSWLRSALQGCQALPLRQGSPSEKGWL